MLGKNQFLHIFFAVMTLSFAGSINSIYAQQDLKTLIKEVQANSSSFYDSINSVRFTGRSKVYLYMSWPLLDLRTVPRYEEYIFEGFWMKPDSLRINIIAVRIVLPDTVETEINSEKPLPNPFQFSFNVSAMGHDVETYENKKGEKTKMWPVYPFAAEADSFYRYRLSGRMSFNGRPIIAVTVSPKFPDIPAVSGTFMIDPDEKIVVGSDVVFNDAVETRKQKIEKLTEKDKKFKLFLLGGISEDRRMKTQKALLYSSYWLPQVIEETLFGKVAGIKIKAHKVFEFDSYIVNPEIEDTAAFANKKLSYTIDPEIRHKLNNGLEDPTKLSEKERSQIFGEGENDFSSMDLSNDLFDSKTLAKEAYNMRIGKKGGRYINFLKNFGDNLIYNRVEGLKICTGINFTCPGTDKMLFSLRAGYSTGDSRFSSEVSAVWFPGNGNKLFFESNLYKITGFNESRRLIKTGKNTLTSLFGHVDYRDYYYKTGGNFGVGFQGTDNLAFKISLVSQKEQSASNGTKFSLFKWRKNFPSNPAILDGDYRGIEAKVLYKTHNLKFGIISEYSDEDLQESDYSFTRVKADFNWNYRINKLNSINFFIDGGLADGSLPPQRWFDFGGKTFINYSGNLRGTGYKYFTGDRMVNGTVEYSFILRDMFERLHEDSEDIRQILKFTVWGGAGWSRLSNSSIKLAAGLDVPSGVTDGVYREFGIGIGDRFNIFRLDFIINNIEKGKVLFGFNFMR